jgi:hypothetical protein
VLSGNAAFSDSSSCPFGDQRKPTLDSKALRR